MSATLDDLRRVAREYNAAKDKLTAARDRHTDAVNAWDKVVGDANPQVVDLYYSSLKKMSLKSEIEVEEDEEA